MAGKRSKKLKRKSKLSADEHMRALANADNFLNSLKTAVAKAMAEHIDKEICSTMK